MSLAQAQEFSKKIYKVNRAALIAYANVLGSFPTRTLDQFVSVPTCIGLERNTICLFSKESGENAFCCTGYNYCRLFGKSNRYDDLDGELHALVSKFLIIDERRFPASLMEIQTL